MIAFIDAHREVHGVEPICEVLPIAPSTYRAHAARRANPGRLPPRAKRDIQLRPEIRRVWDENFQVYGVRKVWRLMARVHKNAAVVALANKLARIAWAVLRHGDKFDAKAVGVTA